MARPINTDPVILKGKEAKRVYKKAIQKNTSTEYKKKMDEYEAYYLAISKKSTK
jgi:hypothetical protein